MPTIRIYAPHRLQEYLALRRKIFVEEQHIDERIEIDEYDTLDNEDVIHFAYWHEKKLIATARAIKIDHDTVKIGRIATDPEYRHMGYASKILNDVEIYFHNINFKTALIHAQVDVLGFYLKNNYQPVGERFMEAGIEHQAMTKQI